MRLGFELWLYLTISKLNCQHVYEDLCNHRVKRILTSTLYSFQSSIRILRLKMNKCRESQLRIEWETIRLDSIVWGVRDTYNRGHTCRTLKTRNHKVKAHLHDREEDGKMSSCADGIPCARSTLNLFPNNFILQPAGWSRCMPRLVLNWDYYPRFKFECAALIDQGWSVSFKQFMC